MTQDARSSALELSKVRIGHFETFPGVPEIEMHIDTVDCRFQRQRLGTALVGPQRSTLGAQIVHGNLNPGATQHQPDAPLLRRPRSQRVSKSVCTDRFGRFELPRNLFVVIALSYPRQSPHHAETTNVEVVKRQTAPAPPSRAGPCPPRGADAKRRRVGFSFRLLRASPVGSQTTRMDSFRQSSQRLSLETARACE